MLDRIAGSELAQRGIERGPGGKLLALERLLPLDRDQRLEPRQRNELAGQIELVPPVFEALDQRGAGDSMFAATGVGLARGMSMIDALRLGIAAGALNATRRGLGSGTRDEIERLAAHVTVNRRSDR